MVKPGGRQYRKLAMQLLTPKAMEGNADSLDYEAHITIQTLKDDGHSGKVPLNPHHYAGRFALNNMLLISFGIRTGTTEDPLIARALELAMEFMDLTGKEILSPSAIRKELRVNDIAKVAVDSICNFTGGMILRIKARLDAGEYVPDCLVKTLIQDQEKEELDWEDLCMLSAVFTLGGVHSTSGIIQWFLALIPSHPKVALQAQEELDRVIGRDRFPTAEDESNLPYVRSIIKKVRRIYQGKARLNSSGVGSTRTYSILEGYSAREDLIYNGEFILKMSVQFRAKSAKSSNVMDCDHWTFGAGYCGRPIFTHSMKVLLEELRCLSDLSLNDEVDD
ncbi:cytochrome P450 [Lentinula aciculospora]|uniref:Cytochrome P450 n=1 Tax=Lentinula aciculospora TaxID=153920 RepID=A0A9W8ZTT0_9AGAR|nr:cytochrome P450 [Lentinula aciculospora]